MITIGIDPGAPGAAVALDERGAVVLVLTWRTSRRGFRLDHYSAIGDLPARDLLPGRPSALGGYLGALLFDRQIGRLACEDVFLHRNLKTTVTLARFGSGMCGPLEQRAGVAVDYVQASTWRAAVLGLRRNTRRAECKAAALRFMPALVPGLDLAMAAVGELDHVADAAGIALWQLRQGRQNG